MKRFCGPVYVLVDLSYISQQHYETLGNKQPSENACAKTTNAVTSALKSWREGAPHVIEPMDSAFTIEEFTFALKSMPVWKAGDHDHLLSFTMLSGDFTSYTPTERKRTS